MRAFVRASLPLGRGAFGPGGACVGLVGLVALVMVLLVLGLRTLRYRREEETVGLASVSARRELPRALVWLRAELCYESVSHSRAGCSMMVTLLGGLGCGVHWRWGESYASVEIPVRYPRFNNPRLLLCSNRTAGQEMEMVGRRFVKYAKLEGAGAAKIIRRRPLESVARRALLMRSQGQSAESRWSLQASVEWWEPEAFFLKKKKILKILACPSYVTSPSVRPVPIVPFHGYHMATPMEGFTRPAVTKGREWYPTKWGISGYFLVPSMAGPRTGPCGQLKTAFQQPLGGWGLLLPNQARRDFSFFTLLFFFFGVLFFFSPACPIHCTGHPIVTYLSHLSPADHAPNPS